MEDGILETFHLMCGTPAPARDFERARCEQTLAVLLLAAALLLLQSMVHVEGGVDTTNDQALTKTAK